MNSSELLFVLGHELSHIKFGHTFWITITSSSGMLRIPIATDVMQFIMLSWSRKAEYTCDRGGLVVCQDLQSCIYALLKLIVGDKLHEKITIEAILSQKEELDDELFSDLAEMFSSHPYMMKRITACRDFYQSNFAE